MSIIKKDIYWTGYIDWELRDFHGYSTPRGSTYNAYLILDEKPVLIDTVKHYGFNEMLRRIKEHIVPERIRYIVSNHTEMDHSGSIVKLLEFCPQAEVVCSPKGREGLVRHFKEDWKFKVVNNGETLNIGKRELKFFLMPMVHWPDSMATYLEESKILFPNDAFGQHYASSQRFAEEIGEDIVFREAAKYYANIVLPYGGQVLKALEVLKRLDIEMIAPSHGLIWRRRQDIDKIVRLYEQWANYRSERKVVIIYDTMWHSTEMIAKRLYELIEKEDIPVKLMSLKTNDPSDIITEVMLAGVIGIGCPILNNRIFPSLGGLLTYLKGLRPRHKFAFTFGSYGWSKKGFGELEEFLKDAAIELIDEGKYFQYIPDSEELDSLGDLAAKVKKFLT